MTEASIQMNGKRLHRLALGSAQFGMNYGINNAIGQVSFEEVRKILESCKLVGIDTLDTAMSYGHAESVLGQAGVQNFRIISKLPPLPANLSPIQINEWVINSVEHSLNLLKISKLYGLLLHQPANLQTENGTYLWQALELCQKQGYVQHIGISIYTPNDLEELWPMFPFQILQTPFNVLDQRIITSGWLERLVNAGVILHARSIFLQGLLLMGNEKLPAYFQPWMKLLRSWFEWCTKQSSSPLDVALHFALREERFARFIVGVDSLQQFEEILRTYEQKCDLKIPDEIVSHDINLIEPRRWQLCK